MQDRQSFLPGLLHVVEQAAVKEGFDSADRPNIVLVFPPLDEGDESGGVQVRGVSTGRWRLRVVQSFPVYHTSRLEPGLLQTGRRRGPSLRLALKQQTHKVSGSRAHALEVVLREAEVQATDVQTCFLQTLIQEGRGTAQ